jgi:hypothetical protein
MRITQSFAGAPGITRYPFDKKNSLFCGRVIKKAARQSLFMAGFTEDTISDLTVSSTAMALRLFNRNPRGDVTGELRLESEATSENIDHLMILFPLDCSRRIRPLSKIKNQTGEVCVVSGEALKLIRPISKRDQVVASF